MSVHESIAQAIDQLGREETASVASTQKNSARSAYSGAFLIKRQILGFRGDFFPKKL